MRYLRYFLVLTLLIALLNNSVPFLDCVLGTLATIFSISITYRYPILSNMGKYMVLIIVWISIVMMPAYHLIVHILGLHDMKQVDYDRVQAFGFELYFVVSIAFLVLGGNTKNMTFKRIIYFPHKFSDRVVVSFFCFLYALTIFCYIKGIGRLGSEPVRLPFHLTGIINLFRQCIVPSLFVMLVEGYIIRNEQIPKKYILMYIIWTLLEVFAWMSKGVLFNYMLGFGLTLYWYYRPSIKSILKFCIPFFVTVLFLYPLVGEMRYVDSGSFFTNLEEAKLKVEDNTESNRGSTILKPLNRVFLTGQMYAQDFDYVSSDDYFDFRRVPALVLYGGAAGFQTRVIDDYPEDAFHSSGTSGIMDPLLHGGKGFCYICLFLLVVLGAIIDNQYSKKQISIYLGLCLYIQGLCTSSNISSLYNAVGLQSMLVTGISLWIMHFINFRNRQYQ